MAGSSVDANATPEVQLRALIAKCTPEHQKLIRAVRAALRKRLPTTNELVYDYGKFIVISYSPSEHGMEGIVSISTRAGGVDLYFNNGSRLPDPRQLLMGSAKQVRFIKLETARRLAHPDVEALIVAAIKASPVPLPSTGGGRVISRIKDTKRKAAVRKPGK